MFQDDSSDFSLIKREEEWKTLCCLIFTVAIYKLLLIKICIKQIADQQLLQLTEERELFSLWFWFLILQSTGGTFEFDPSIKVLTARDIEKKLK